MMSEKLAGIDHTVVGVDGRGAGWQALVWAVDDVARTGGRLTICHVHPVQVITRPAGRLATGPVPDEAGRALLDRAMSIAGSRLCPSRIETVTAEGDIADELVRLSKAARITVVGNTLTGHLGAELFGSTTLRVLAQAHSPVVAVRRLPDRHGPFAGHVVVCVDGRHPASVTALRYGFAHAAAHDLPLAAVHAATDGWPGDFWMDDRLLEVNFAAPPAALNLLARAVEQVAPDYPDVPVKRAVVGGRTAAALRRAGQSAALLVVGDRGRGMVSRLLLGSVSRDVVTHAGIPVAVVRA